MGSWGVHAALKKSQAYQSVEYIEDAAGRALPKAA